MASILDVKETTYFDNSIVRAEKHPHLPYASTSFEKNDEIRIPIQQTDIYTLPSNSNIYIEGKVTAAKNLSACKLVNNAFTHLFDEIRYELGGKIIDQVRNPGVTSTLKGYVSYNHDDVKLLSNAGWSDSKEVEILDATNGNFNVSIPLRMVLGFAEDFNKIIMNVHQELILIRANTDNNVVYSTTGDEKIEISIQKIIWRVPHIQVSDVERLRLLKVVDTNSELTIAFRAWELYEYPTLPKTEKHSWMVKSTTQLEKPRYIIIGFQTNRKNVLNANASQFDHCKLNNLKLFLNSEAYPYDSMNIKFSQKRIANLYDMYANFQYSYYDKHSRPLFDLKTFMERAPIVTIDCSRQNELLNAGTVDIRLEFDYDSALPDNTTCYCLILHDKIVKYIPLTGLVRVL
jgi:hypothetical protein